MEAKVTDKNNYEKVVEVDVPASELLPHFDKAYEKYQKNLKLEGFRKGKVPLSIIKRLYGDAIKAEAIDDIIQSIFLEVRRKEKLRTVAPAKLEDINYDPDKGVHFKATVEVVPEINLKNYKGLSVEQETYQVDDKDVEHALEDVREKMAVMTPVEDEAKENHYIVADFQQVDQTGIPIIGKKFADRYFQLNENETNKNFKEQLLGIKPGETRRVRLETSDESGKNNTIEFYDVNVKEIKSKQLPELDDELAKDTGDFVTLEDLKKDIKIKLENQTEANAKRGLRHKLIDELLKKNAFDLPESMVGNYLEYMIESAKRNNSKQKVDEDALKKEYRASAIWNIKWELVKDKITEIENIAVAEDDKEKYLEQISKERNIDINEIKKSLSNKETARRLEEDLLEEKVLDFLEENAKIKEKKITRKDIEKANKLAVK